mmetsp:Transcript_22215/g.25259  ORF Transcript_22215/g.25259 Transcript_22215/m.25259 type:complete len:455 (-) Transcript_22215:10-1374(-)
MNCFCGHFWLLLSLLIPLCTGKIETEDIDQTSTIARLSNDNFIPLVGVGVGNLQHELIDKVVSTALASDKKNQLFDTARASRNEHIIANAISKSSGILQRPQGAIHIVTKVWYTYLGYERTKLSVLESLNDISSSVHNIPIHVHMLLHWPRCNDDIPWMNCEEEENNLPKYVKDAGPPPHLDKKNAWKDSWRALEDLYIEHEKLQKLDNNVFISSIGVSNFDFDDMKELVKDSRIKPHVIQGNIWSLMYDPYLMSLLREHNIFFQAYNVMNGVWQQRSKTPIAFSILTKIGNNLSAKIRRPRLKGNKDLTDVTEAMVIMSWLIEQGIGIIPRASSSIHQKENSVVSLGAVPILTNEEKEQVKKSVSALLSGVDMKVEVTFHNTLPSGHVQIKWKNLQTGEEVQVADKIHPGETNSIQTHPGHTFVVYDAIQKLRREFVVSASYGEKERFLIDEF